MANPEKFRAHAAGIAETLFVHFLAPLVIGGEARPSRPIGTRIALALGPYPETEDPRLVIERKLGDIDLVAHVELARVRIARKLAPVDRMGEATWPEWAMAAALHDIVQSTHPGWNGALRKRGPGKLLAMVDATLDAVPLPRTVGEALSRHTWFSRMFELARIDSTVSWWTGHALFRGEPPPARLTAWPELRSVQVARASHSLTELAEPTVGSVVSVPAYVGTVGTFLRATPLTDLATTARSSPRFGWSPGTLALIGCPFGQRLALRALAAQPTDAVDEALGAATKQLLEGRTWRAGALALEILRERALAVAESAVSVGGAASGVGTSASTDAARFARGAGARLAERWIAMNGARFRSDERERLLAVLAPASSSSGAKELDALLHDVVSSGAPTPPLPVA